MKKAFSGINNNFILFYFFFIVISIILTIFCLSGCITQSNEKINNIPIKIGANIWPGSAYTFIAADKGFFKNNGVNVKLILNKEYSQTQNLYVNGDIDGFFAVFPEVILYNAQGNKTVVVFITDYSDSADVIVANPIYNSIKTLKGKRIGIENINSFSHLFVLEVFRNEGITESEMRFEIVPSQEITEALDANRIEAGHTWNPEKTEALKKGYKILAKAGDIPGLITDILALKEKLVKERPLDVSAILKSILQARDFFDTNPQESLKIMAKYEGSTVGEMAASINEVHLFDLKENLSAMEPSSQATSLFGEGSIISDYYLNRGQISSLPDLGKIIDPSFLKKIAAES